MFHNLPSAYVVFETNDDGDMKCRAVFIDEQDAIDYCNKNEPSGLLMWAKYKAPWIY